MTTAQSIGLATKFMPILDEIYKAGSVTSRLDGLAKPVNFAGANIVEIFQTTVLGLGTYSKLNGYPKGKITGAWVPYQLTQDRGREFNIDRMDNEESLGMAFGTLAGEFIRTQVAPEIDAYRFSKYYAATSGLNRVASGATLSSGTVVAALSAGTAAMNADEVPYEGRVLFVSDTVAGFMADAITRIRQNESAVDSRVTSYDGMPVIVVPAGRFWTTCTPNAGADIDSGGYATGGVGINFMIVYPPAVMQVTKLAQLKIWNPDENQEMDAWKLQYRIYHDAFAYDNRKNGIYAHMLGA